MKVSRILVESGNIFFRLFLIFIPDLEALRIFRILCRLVSVLEHIVNWCHVKCILVLHAYNYEECNLKAECDVGRSRRHNSVIACHLVMRWLIIVSCVNISINFLGPLDVVDCIVQWQITRQVNQKKNSKIGRHHSDDLIRSTMWQGNGQKLNDW